MFIFPDSVSEFNVNITYLSKFPTMFVLKNNNYVRKSYAAKQPCGAVTLPSILFPNLHLSDYSAHSCLWTIVSNEYTICKEVDNNSFHHSRYCYRLLIPSLCLVTFCFVYKFLVATQKFKNSFVIFFKSHNYFYLQSHF